MFFGPSPKRKTLLKEDKKLRSRNTKSLAQGIRKTPFKEDKKQGKRKTQGIRKTLLKEDERSCSPGRCL